MNPGLSYNLAAQSPTDLAAMSVAALPVGQRALVMAMRSGSGPGLYILQPTISAAPDGFFVVATRDDSSLQWVYGAIQENGSLFVYSQEIDLTVIQTVTIFPPVYYRFQSIQVPQWSVSALNGSVTSGPRTQLGTDAGITDICTSTVQTNVAAGPVNLTVAMQGTTTTPGNLDLSTNGVRLQITVAAVLNTATVFKARLKVPVGLTKF